MDCNNLSSNPRPWANPTLNLKWLQKGVLHYKMGIPFLKHGNQANRPQTLPWAIICQVPSFFPMARSGAMAPADSGRWLQDR